MSAVTKTLIKDSLPTLDAARYDAELTKVAASPAAPSLQFNRAAFDAARGAATLVSYTETTNPDLWTLSSLLPLSAALAAARAEGLVQNVTVDGDLFLEPLDPWFDRHVVVGDLTVTGRLDLRQMAMLIVLGDLRVGEMDDSGGYGSGGSLLVAGNLHAKRYVHTRGFLGVGGDVEAPCVFMDFNQNQSHIVGDVKARVLWEFDHGGSAVYGKVYADAIIATELQFKSDAPTPIEDDEIMAALKPIVDDATYAALGEAEELMSEGPKIVCGYFARQ